MKAKTETKPDTKRYAIEKTDGECLRITVPSNWKVTFGPLIGGGKNKFGDDKPCPALRFYEDEKHQRAIFTQVRSFIDMSIPVEKWTVVESVDEARATKTPNTYEKKGNQYVREDWQLLPW